MTTTDSKVPATVIRAGQLSDLDALCQLEADSFSYDQIGRRSFRRLLHSTSAQVYVGQSAQGIVAYAIVLTRRNSRYWRLYSMATSSKVRGQGVGKALLQHIMACARAPASGLRLEVKCDNQPALKLYQQLGFEVVDLLPDYYSDGSDGYRMQLSWAAAQ